MSHFKTVYTYSIYRDTVPFDCYQDINNFYENNDNETNSQSILWPITVYLAFWAISLGSFTYGYYKCNGYNNRICNVVDTAINKCTNCIEIIFPKFIRKIKYPSYPYIQELKQFDINSLTHINNSVKLTDSDQEYINENEESNEKTLHCQQKNDTFTAILNQIIEKGKYLNSNSLIKSSESTFSDDAEETETNEQSNAKTNEHNATEEATEANIISINKNEAYENHINVNDMGYTIIDH